MYINNDIRWLYGVKRQHINNKQIPSEQSGRGVFKKLDSMLTEDIDIYHIDSYTTTYQGASNRFQGVFYNIITKEIIECPFSTPDGADNGQGSYTLYNV